MWATELWWETNPPDRQFAFPMRKVERFIPEALRVLWKQGVSVVIWGQLYDDPLTGNGFGLQDGLFFNDGREKPLFQAWRFPFVANRTSKKRIVAWTLAPASGEVTIEQKKGGGWRTVGRGQARFGVPLEVNLNISGRATLRARQGSEVSPPWTAGPK